MGWQGSAGSAWFSSAWLGWAALGWEWLGWATSAEVGWALLGSDRTNCVGLGLAELGSLGSYELGWNKPLGSARLGGVDNQW